MNDFEKKQKLLGDAMVRSLANPKDVHYVLYDGCSGFVTTDAERAKTWMSQGYKLYCKMLDGLMIL